MVAKGKHDRGGGKADATLATQSRLLLEAQRKDLPIASGQADADL